MQNVLENPEGIKGRWNSDYFQNDNPNVLELGCGKGEYTVALARQYPDHNYIGVDVKGVRLWKGAKFCLENGIINAAFLRVLIESMDEYFAKDEVSEIWLTFPDPQPKKSKAKKRLMSPRYLNIYDQVLEPHGLLHLKTDNEHLFQYAMETIPAEGWQIIAHTWDLYHSELYDELTSIPTHYEQKFGEDGTPIKYMRFKR